MCRWIVVWCCFRCCFEFWMLLLCGCSPLASCGWLFACWLLISLDWIVFAICLPLVAACFLYVFVHLWRFAFAACYLWLYAVGSHKLRCCIACRWFLLFVTVDDLLVVWWVVLLFMCDVVLLKFLLIWLVWLFWCWWFNFGFGCGGCFPVFWFVTLCGFCVIVMISINFVFSFYIYY